MRGKLESPHDWERRTNVMLLKSGTTTKILMYGKACNGGAKSLGIVSVKEGTARDRKTVRPYRNLR